MKSFYKAIGRIVTLTLLGVGFAQAQVSMPDPNSPGASMDSAIRLVTTNDMMLERQISRWLRAHYPGWDADPHEFQDFGDERYAIVYIRHKDHPSRRVYFRVLKSHADPDARPEGFPF